MLERCPSHKGLHFFHNVAAKIASDPSDAFRTSREYSVLFIMPSLWTGKIAWFLPGRRAEKCLLTTILNFEIPYIDTSPVGVARAARCFGIFCMDLVTSL